VLQVHEITYISTINGKKEEERKEEKETNKQTNLLHAQAAYCTHKQQLHQLRKIVSQPQCVYEW